MCTGMMALVRGVTARAAAARSRVKGFGSTSTRTGGADGVDAGDKGEGGRDDFVAFADPHGLQPDDERRRAVHHRQGVLALVHRRQPVFKGAGLLALRNPVLADHYGHLAQLLLAEPGFVVRDPYALQLLLVLVVRDIGLGSHRAPPVVAVGLSRKPFAAGAAASAACRSCQAIVPAQPP